jgi:hypothetical protein
MRLVYQQVLNSVCGDDYVLNSLKYILYVTYLYMIMECIICFEVIENSDLLETTVCQHIFHKQCIHTLIKYNKYRASCCPLCRAILPKHKLFPNDSHMKSTYELHMELIWRRERFETLFAFTILSMVLPLSVWYGYQINLMSIIYTQTCYIIHEYIINGK